MTDNAESASIDLSVNADAALETFQQLSTAARAADTDIQALKERLSTLTNNQEATGATMPEIAQTRQALNVRRAEMTSRAMDFVGANPQVVTQPLPDTLAQFQETMAERAQQQQAQRERQAQQQAADVERPARYGYDTPPPVLQAQAASRPIAAMAPTMQVAGPMSVAMAAPLATTGDARLAQALSVQASPIPAIGTSAGRGDNAATSALPDDLQRLAAAAIAADEAIRRLQERLVEQVNAQMGAAGIRPQSFQQAQDLLQRMPAADLATAAPEITVTQQAISARSAQVTGQVADFAGQSPPVSGQPISQLLDEFKAFVQQQQASTASGAPPSLSGGGAGSGGDTSAVARYGLLPATSPQSSLAANDTTQSDRFATTIGERLTSSMARAGVGMLSGGISGAANAAGMGATGDLVGALARPLMELVSAPLAIGAAVIGGAAGIGLGVNALQSKYAGEQQGLAGSVGTTTGATPSSELTTAQQAGWAMMYHEADSVAAARQLGDMGVQSGQLGAGLTASMALSRVGSIGLDQTTNLTGSLMQSGMSGNQVGDYFAQLDQAARQSGVSVARLTEGIVHLNQAAGIGQISVNGLAAAQALTDQSGTKIDIAQAMSGAIGATGTTALAQGALLGLNPAQFEAATQDPAKLLDSYANLAKRYDVGTGGVQVAQQAMSAAGFDFSHMDSHQADVFTRKLVSEGPGAAQKYEDSLTKKENAPNAPGPHNFDELTKAGVTVAHNITSASEQAKLDFEQGAAALVRGAQNAANIADAASRDPRYTKSGTDLSAGANPHHIQPTRPLQSDSTVIMGPPSPFALGINPSGIDFTNPTQLAHQAKRNQAVWDAHNQTLQQADLANNRVGDASQLGWDASGDARFGAISGTAVNQGEAGQLKVEGASLSASTFSALEAATQRTGVPLPVLLAQARQEATVNGKIDPSAISSDGGYGLGQFTDQASAVQYLGQASHELGLGAVTASNWHQAALNPKIAAQGMADYDAANLASKAAGGRWDKALAQYNAGPNGWNYTGHPGQGRDYGTGIAQGAVTLQVQLAGSVDITQNGQKVGTAQAGQHIRAKATHSVDPHKRVVAAQSYGPTDNQSPTVGMPLQLPGHIK